MFDPNAMTVGELFTLIRDGGILITICAVGWKARAAIQPIAEFFIESKRLMRRAEKHMDVMESGMTTLLDNHLEHISDELRQLARNQVRATSSEQESYLVADSTSDIQAEAESGPDADIQV